MVKWDVVSVEPRGPFRLEVRFKDGTKGDVRFEPSALQGVLEPLSDAHFFEQVFTEDGAVAWPGNVDIAPDAMHAEIAENGEWIIS